MDNFLSVEHQRKHPRPHHRRYVPDLGDSTPPITMITGAVPMPAT